MKTKKNNAELVLKQIDEVLVPPPFSYGANRVFIPLTFCLSRRATFESLFLRRGQSIPSSSVLGFIVPRVQWTDGLFAKRPPKTDSRPFTPKRAALNHLSVNPKRVSLTEVFVWGGAGYLGFAIELLGDMLSHANHSWRLSPSTDYIRTAVILFTALSPFPALYALSKAQHALREAYPTSLRVFLWIFVVLGVFVSLAESMWTCSGHPTWLLGYDG